MHTQLTSMKSILWQNKEKTITLIDIPGSIAAAQGTNEEPYTLLLQTTEPLQKPFDIHAPTRGKKTPSTQANLKTSAEADVIHHDYCNVLEMALQTLKSAYHGQWCLPRPFVSQRDLVTKPSDLKRDRRAVESVVGDDLPPNLFERVVRPSLMPIECCMEPQGDVSEGDCMHDHGSHIWASTTVPATLIITSHDIHTARSERYRFRLPARSTAFMGDCSEPQSFHEVFRRTGPLSTEHRAAESNLGVKFGGTACDEQQKFAFILLDPPWPNRSVKRTHKTPGTSYSTTNLDDLKAMLDGLDLRSLMSETGYVGIWITNKLAIRKLVLGLFDMLGIRLVQEWIWLKTTVHGDPASPLRDTWNGKRPYEVLLIGHATALGEQADATLTEECSTFQSHSSTVERKFIIGVPDLHSRKPCLKELIEDLIGTDAQVLEVFARYLVAGWWSWGNECLKYNWEGYWREADEAEKKLSEDTLSTSIK